MNPFRVLIGQCIEARPGKDGSKKAKNQAKIEEPLKVGNNGTSVEVNNGTDLDTGDANNGTELEHGTQKQISRIFHLVAKLKNHVFE